MYLVRQKCVHHCYLEIQQSQAKRHKRTHIYFGPRDCINSSAFGEEKKSLACKTLVLFDSTYNIK